MAEFIKITGLYEAKDKNGNIYYKGHSGDKTYWLTPNRNKKSEKHPDMELAYTVNDPNYKKGEPTKTQGVQAVQPVAQVVSEVVDDSDVPF